MPLDAAAQDVSTTLGTAGQPVSAALGTSYGPDMVRRLAAAREDTLRKSEAAKAPVQKDIDAQASKDKERYEKAADAYKPVAVTEQPKVPENDPFKGFASAAGVFAALASAFTHTPAVNAMNGLAAAINATKENDWKAYEAGYKQWKDGTELAIQNHKLQADDIKLAMEAMQTNASLGQARLKAAGAVFDDRLTTMIAETGDYEKLDQVMRARQSAAASMQEHALRIEEQHQKIMDQRERHQLAQDYMNAPTPEAKEAARQKILAFEAGTVPGAAETQRRDEMMGAYRSAAGSKAKWNLLTDDDGTQFLQTITPDGKPINQTITGEPYQPSHAYQLGKEDAPGAAARKDASEDRKVAADAEKARHDKAMETLQADKSMTAGERFDRVQSERERHDKEVERISGIKAVPKQTPESRIAADQFTQQFGREPNLQDTSDSAKVEYRCTMASGVAPS